MKSLNYHHLLYFREIALAKSVSRAAANLNLGQPTLSSQLRTLEEQLGQKLFSRHGRTLVLTDTGKLVLRHANEIHQSGAALIDVLESGLLSSKIHIEVGVLESVPKHLVLRLVADARAIGPCRITLRLGRADELLRELRAHALDFIISDHPAPVSEGGTVHSRLLTKAAIVVFGAARFKPLRRRFPRSLEGQPFIVPTHHSRLRHEIEHCLRSLELNVEFAVETQDTALQKLLAVDGYGVLPLPRFSTMDLVKEKKLFPLGTMAAVTEEFWLISIRRVIENPIATRLVRDFAFSL